MTEQSFIRGLVVAVVAFLLAMTLLTEPTGRADEDCIGPPSTTC